MSLNISLTYNSIMQTDINVSLIRTGHRLLNADELIEEANSMIKKMESLLKDSTM
jgi:hypothetical protein